MWPWRLTYDFEIQQGSRGCQGTCSCKISSSWVQRFMSHRGHKLFAISPNGKESKISVSCDLDLWPMTSIEILWVSSSCQDPRCCRISSSGVQRSMSNGGKNSDENNTVHRYRADSNKITKQSGKWRPTGRQARPTIPQPTNLHTVHDTLSQSCLDGRRTNFPIGNVKMPDSKRITKTEIRSRTKQ